MQNSINEAAIKETAVKNKTAEELFTLWATRSRNARGDKTTVEETRRQMKKEGFTRDAKELTEVFKSLAAAGAGDLRGKVFRWGKLGLREVARLALKKSPVLKTGVAKEISFPGVQTNYAVVSAELSGGRRFRVEFPSDLTSKERELIKGMVDVAA